MLYKTCCNESAHKMKHSLDYHTSTAHTFESHAMQHLHVAHEGVLAGRICRHAGGVRAVQRDETQAERLQRPAQDLPGSHDNN